MLALKRYSAPFWSSLQCLAEMTNRLLMSEPPHFGTQSPFPSLSTIITCQGNFLWCKDRQRKNAVRKAGLSSSYLVFVCGKAIYNLGFHCFLI